jgi:hypothetical protein
VRDAKTKKPIVGARVTVKEHPKATAFTGNDGSFDIPSETHWGFIMPPVEPVGLADTVVVTKARYRLKTTRVAYDRFEILVEPY